MTPEQLQEIERRVQMARPGPWQFREGASVKGSIVGNGWHVDLISNDYEAWASVNFIAHARQDVPVLLAEVKRLQAEVTRWQARARLYHNHLVMLQGDGEAIIQ